MGGSLVAANRPPDVAGPWAGGHHSITQRYAAELAQRHTAE
ncbi:MAG TPA: hypothetical protein VFY98_13930 [Intrasporangium sp.]|nr:hypothetical protein [Intrasporangium sp.]